MAESLLFAGRGRGRRWPGARSAYRTGRRTVAESLYLLTAPVTAVAGLVVVLGGLCAGTFGLLVPGGAPAVAGALELARWPADVERWRIAKVRAAAAVAPDRGRRPRTTVPRTTVPRTTVPRTTAGPSDLGLWLDVAHAVAVVPVVVITWVVTALWWIVGVAVITFPLRGPGTSGPLRPQTLYLPHVTLSLWLGSPGAHLAFSVALGLALLLTLPLVTRACTTAQAGLGRVLLWDVPALHRRIRGLEQERDTARAQTVAAVSAEATALRRLERDLHDGPQQRLVRLAMDLGRAQHQLDSRPETVRETLADAIAQAQEALEELRGLSRGIAPPILTDRGLGEAITALAARSSVPVRLDLDPLDHRPDAAVEGAAYFAVAESLTNVAKHSNARQCVIGLRHGAGTLRIWVTDDGTGGAALDKGHGLRGLEDRLHAAGGRLRVASPRGGPTTVTAELPCR